MFEQFMINYCLHKYPTNLLSKHVLASQYCDYETAARATSKKANNT
ncbi:hypothetical protein GPAL_1089 [Glaciecola pallidula DSM 14239 = ACAM 615]|uniref:Uncharacterized protein n=1 Tax=Brumicola pallidula DSM 14239 = ACAM 615 TaxID=1121922 RepID=K6ZGB3_9ALTE|nr:hypothetical protein GPAL_1089 [Glaciecola pallidula DSM 14239 = ACAM 615]